MMTGMSLHTDPNTPVRFVPAVEYVAKHRARTQLRAILAGWLAAGDWRLLAGALACLLAALVLAIATM